MLREWLCAAMGFGKGGSFAMLSLAHVCVWFFFFFFQAEDGIRDRTVTGVQTCALPIFVEACGDQVADQVDAEERLEGDLGGGRERALEQRPEGVAHLHVVPVPLGGARRSEERRVGKEGRWRWWPWS